MECINCGSRIEPNTTDCPHCGKFKSVSKGVSAENIDNVFGKMIDKAAKSVERAKREAVTIGGYDSDLRQQVYGEIVTQMVAGAPGQESCAGPMAVNKITEDVIAKEVERRRQSYDSEASGKEDEKK